MNLSMKQKQTHIENRPVVAKREGRLGEGWIRRQGLAGANYIYIYIYMYVYIYIYIYTQNR